MCDNCGCSNGNSGNSEGRTVEIEIEMDILEKNNQIAHKNWHWFDDRKIKTFNLMSSPGTGKTLLLEKTLEHLGKKHSISIIVGDQHTANDADRLDNKGGKVKQINTTNSCHLDASMIQRELGNFITGEEDYLIIENVGNLICPAAFKLGEKIRVGLLSTTEGEDKPLKYPVLFHNVDVVVITKTDLIPHLDWELGKAREFIKRVNPKAQIIELSAKTGAGMDQWLEYILS